MPTWRENLHNAMSPDGVMAYGSQLPDNNPNWEDNFRKACTPDGIKISGAGGAGFEARIVSELPATGENGVIYLVPHQGGTAPNIYDEYLWIASTSSFETIGSTQIDLSEYVKNTDYATSSSAGIVQVNASYGTGISSNHIINAATKTFEQYESGPAQLIVGKGTLDNVLAGKQIVSTVVLSQAEYDALTEYADNTEYLVY